ncbi:hypothetical protein Mgra_00009021 [Meloidogyne graminicola]|uniref:Uncharacterized protein n=1 Tax=Meloidogyne graminicola TaxID=189291 RepID=A0A8S9ZE62_9BILA|nr:hypothetical protein Mgra_00009021 [Meloidogyne graminicola]
MSQNLNNINQTYNAAVLRFNNSSRVLREECIELANLSLQKCLHHRKGERITFINQGLEWLKKASEIAKDFNSLILHAKFLGFSVSESNNTRINAKHSYAIYKILKELERIRPNDPEVKFLRGVMAYYGASLNSAQRFAARLGCCFATNLLREATFAN